MEGSTGIPIKIQDKVVGVINVDEKSFRDAYGEDGFEALKGVGNFLAISIRSAQAASQIRMLDSIKTDFISSFPHELRTPITVIKESISMLSKGSLGQISDKQKDVLTLAENNLARLWRLSEELLELSEAALAKTPMRRKLLDIGTLISGIADAHRPAAKAKGVSVTFGPPDAKLEIWGDETKLRQMADCIIDNAVRYTDGPGKVAISLEDADKSVRIVVSDTGTGIDKEDLGRIFDKFYRVTMRARNEDRKWGIGLPVVKDIIDMHGGQISVQSEAGKGSVFTVTLPKSLRGGR